MNGKEERRGNPEGKIWRANSENKEKDIMFFPLFRGLLHQREIFGVFIGYHGAGSIINAAIANVLDEIGIAEMTAIGLRNDDGTQFVCSKIERLLHITHL